VAEVKLTKNELRIQQVRLTQLQRYLPTLKLKKAMLQNEVADARVEIREKEKAVANRRQEVEKFCPLFSEVIAIDLVGVAAVSRVEKEYENIAGVEVPSVKEVHFKELEYSLIDTPPWLDSAVNGIRGLSSSVVEVTVAEEKKAALEKELREVSIRVNLFEKILIPRSIANIKKIKVFLGDQELSAVAQAKVAKGKIQERKMKKQAAARPDDEHPREVLYAS
jgi:V/A-type H+-transporting ATPase subunit D